MEAQDKYIIKVALETLQAAGGQGVSEKALRAQIDLVNGVPATTEQLDAAIAMLRDRGWMTYHMEPVWHTKRWTLTERGLTALEGM